MFCGTDSAGNVRQLKTGLEYELFQIFDDKYSRLLKDLDENKYIDDNFAATNKFIIEPINELFTKWIALRQQEDETDEIQRFCDAGHPMNKLLSSFATWNINYWGSGSLCSDSVGMDALHMTVKAYFTKINDRNKESERKKEEGMRQEEVQDTCPFTTDVQEVDSPMSQEAVTPKSQEAATPVPTVRNVVV